MGKVKMGARPAITHDRLVSCAKRWLTHSKGCRVVAAELRSGIFEEPDAIGWSSYGASILIECKVSRSDFFADRKKSRTGVGREKWYLTPPGLVKPHEVPEGWGLAEYRPSNHPSGYFVKVVKEPPEVVRGEGYDMERMVRLQNEQLMLISIAARSLQALALVGRFGVGEGE